MHPTTLIFLSYYQQIKIYNKKNSWLLCLADITSWFIIYQILTPIWHGFSYWPFHRLTVNHQDHYDSPRTYNRDNMKIPINWQFYHPSCWSRFCVHPVKNIFICVTPCFYWGLQCGKRPLANSPNASGNFRWRARSTYYSPVWRVTVVRRVGTWKRLPR